MNAFRWKKTGIAMLAALIAIQSLWIVTGTGGEAVSAAALEREWQPVGTGVAGERTENLDLTIHNGTPYLIYTDSSVGRQIRVKKWESGSWQYAGNNGDGIANGHTLEWASSPDGALYASYLSDGSYIPAVLTLDQDEWSKLGGIDLTSGMSTNSDIAVGADGIVYVIYEDIANGNKATLRMYDGMAWSEPEAASGDYGSHPALAVGSDGKLLIAYANGEDGYYLPLVKRKEDASWSVVGGYPFTYISGYYFTIKFASDGSIYLAYNSGNNDENGRTDVFRFDGAAWSNIGSWSSNKNLEPELAIDPTDQRPVIAYLDRSVDGGSMHVKKWNGSAWAEIGQVGDLAAGADQPSLAISSDGTPYLAYVDTSNDYKPIVLGFLPESNPPVITAQTPAPGATDAPTDAGLTLTFDEDVQAVAGKMIEICPNGSVCEQVDAGSARVKAEGQTVTIAPSDEWAVSTVYTVLIEAGSFTDLNGNPALGVTGWTFTTSATPTDTLKPRITNATVGRDSLFLDFTEPLVKPEWRYFGVSDFEVRVNDSVVQIGMAAEVQGSDQVIIVLAQPVVRGDTVTVAYIGGSDITDEAGNVVDASPVNVTNNSPGVFQTSPELLINMKASHKLRAGESIARFVPSISGAIYIEFVLPNELNNAPALRNGAIARTDFVIKDIGSGTERIPRAVTVDMDVHKIYFALPDGVSLTQGNTYELAMSARAAGDEIVMPANPTSGATAYLALLDSGHMGVVDEYTFNSVVIGEKEPVVLTALTNAIAAAQTKHDAAVEGGADGNYEAGSKAALKATIDAAVAVQGDTTSEQVDVDAAVAALYAAVAAFDAKLVVVDLTALAAVIDAAQEKLDAATEGGAVGNYQAGAKAALKAAINSAVAVKDNTASTQAQINAAVTALNAAVTAFESKKIVSSGPPGGGSSGGGGAVQPTQPASTGYSLSVSFGGGKAGTLTIKRATDSGGGIMDTLELTDTLVEQAVQQLNAAGMDQLIITIPASQTAADELSIALPAKAAAQLASGKISLVIKTPEAGMSIPSSSFQGVDEALTFTIVPVRSAANQLVIEQRANDSEVIQAMAGGGEVTLIGQPIDIETNLQQRKVTLTLPLEGDAEWEGAGVYIEHSDGTRELVRGRIVESDDGPETRSVVIEVDKFSTFAVVNVAGWTEYEESGSIQLLDAPYMSGYEGGLFKPTASLTRAEMAVILARVIGGEAGEEPISFTDVPASHWAHEAIAKIAEYGFMSGYPDGLFHPDKPITRAEMAAILSLLPITAEYGAEETEDFSDTASHWAKEAINKARAAGLLNGYSDGSFQPERVLTRAEAVTIMNKLIGRQTSGNDKPLYVDVPKTHWAYEDIQAAAME